MQYTHHYNAARFSKQAESAAALCMQNLAQWAEAVDEIRTWPEYSPQPLRTLPGLARKVGVEQLFVKDESKRFGSDMASFKALGAPYTIYKILADEIYAKTGVRPSSAELRTSKYQHIPRNVTVCVATDGNHGRGLAYGAQVFGCRCVDYIHSHVSDGRADRMKKLGAVVIRINGEYEVFVCGGVGSIAAAIFQGFYTHLRSASSTGGRPRFIVVEPSDADCLLQSAKNGEARECEGSLHTLMAGLACRAPYPAALKVLTWFASDFFAVPDSVAVDGMKALAYGEEGDIPVVCGEPSAASMGIMLGSSEDQPLREKLALNSSSQVMLFGLEGATDPQIYKSLVGKSAHAVFEAQDGLAYVLAFTLTG